MANKVGDTKGSGKSRRRWDGRRWVSAPPRRTPASPTRTRQENRRSTRGQGNRTLSRSSKPGRTIPASSRPADMRRGVTYGDAGRPYKGPGGNPNGSGQGQAQQAPPAPKLPPKPTATKPRKPATSTAPAKPPKTPAKAKPKATKPPTPAKRKPRSWLKENYKPGAKGVKSSRLSKALTNLKVRDYKKKK
jgi:hypothetical protein